MGNKNKIIKVNVCMGFSRVSVCTGLPRTQCDGLPRESFCMMFILGSMMPRDLICTRVPT